jgi:hypothetical protein
MTNEEKGITSEAQIRIDREDQAFTSFQRAIYTFMLVVFFGVMATIGVWYFEPVPSENYQRELLTKQVYPGGEIKLHIQVTWTKTCYSRLRRNIVYSNGVLVPFEREIRLNKEGHRDFVISQLIPEDAPPGPTKWIVITEWFCNPLQYWVPKSVDLEPLEFEILPPKGIAP